MPHRGIAGQMATRHSTFRIAVNVVLDGLLAAGAVPLARVLLAPDVDPLTPAWTVPWGALALLIAGLPFRLSVQYWRFAGTGDLLGVAAASLTGAMLFSLGLHGAGLGLPAPTFPAVHALTLMVLLAAPRVVLPADPGKHLRRRRRAAGAAGRRRRAGRPVPARARRRPRRAVPGRRHAVAGPGTDRAAHPRPARSSATSATPPPCSPACAPRTACRRCWW